jgi:hypothetical protein
LELSHDGDQDRRGASVSFHALCGVSNLLHDVIERNRHDASREYALAANTTRLP